MVQKRNSKKIKIAFPLIWNKDWMGGYNYYRTLIDCIITDHSNSFEAIIFTYPKFTKRYLQYFKKNNIKIIYLEELKPETRYREILKNILTGRSTNILKKIKENEINVIIENSFYFGWRIGIPVIAWFPDFQHKDLKYYFKIDKFYKREVGFYLQLLSNRTILLSSYDAKKRFLTHYSLFKNANIKILNFTQKIKQTKSTVLFNNKRDIPKDFFLISNQFYEHKNHKIILKAVHHIKIKYNITINIVLTGSKYSIDNNKKYFCEFISMSKELNISDQIIYLDLVSYDELIYLLINSKAYINPSLYEGWNSTVELAKNFHKKLILSNIKVHREQLGSKAAYFNPRNHQTLAKKILMNNNNKKSDINTKFVEDQYDKFSNKLRDLFFSVI